MQKFLILNLFLIICILPFQALADQYQCLSSDMAQKAKTLLEESKFMIEFCSNCSAEASNIRRIDIKKVSTKTSECGEVIFIDGKIVRGIKPPVFGGECTELLEVNNPSMKINIDFSDEIDLAYTYIWNKENKQFTTAAEALGLDTKNICIKKLILKK